MTDCGAAARAAVAVRGAGAGGGAGTEAAVAADVVDVADETIHATIIIHHTISILINTNSEILSELVMPYSTVARWCIG